MEDVPHHSTVVGEEGVQTGLAGFENIGQFQAIALRPDSEQRNTHRCPVCTIGTHGRPIRLDIDSCFLKPDG